MNDMMSYLKLLSKRAESVSVPRQCAIASIVLSIILVNSLACRTTQVVTNQSIYGSNHSASIESGQHEDLQHSDQQVATENISKFSEIKFKDSQTTPTELARHVSLPLMLNSPANDQPLASERNQSKADLDSQQKVQEDLALVTSPLPYDEDDLSRNYLQSSLMVNLTDDEVTTVASLNDLAVEATVSTREAAKKSSEEDQLQAMESGVTLSSNISRSSTLDQDSKFKIDKQTAIRHSLPISIEPTTSSSQFDNPIQASTQRGNRNNETSTQSTLIPQAGISDLLSIIKHLNLIENSASLYHKQQLEMDDSTANKGFNVHRDRISQSLPFTVPMNWLIEPPRQATMFGSGQGAQELNTLESSPIGKETLPEGQQHQQQQRQVIVAPNVDRNTPSNFNKTVRSVVKIESGGRPKIERKKPAKHSLVSPYSTTFDPGLPLKESGPRTGEPLAEKTNASSGQSQSIKSTSPKEPSSGSEQTRGLPIVYISADEATKTSPTVRTIRLNKGQQIKMKAMVSGEKTENGETKRGERQAVDRQRKSGQKVDEIGANDARPLVKFNSVRALDSTTSKPTSGTRYKTEEAKLDTTSFDSIGLHLNPNTYETISKLGPNPFESKLSYLDDPHKKALYYTNDHQSGPYSDDAIYSPMRPLTVGELAQQHGVPFRLKSPLGDDYRIASSYDDHGMPAESGSYEDFVYLPYKHKQEGSVSEQYLPGTSLKLDDELKQRLAMKAIEAVTRDSEFANHLFGNLYGSQMSNPLPSASSLVGAHPTLSSHNETSPALRKLYTNLLNANGVTAYNHLLHQPSSYPMLASPSISVSQEHSNAMMLSQATNDNGAPEVDYKNQRPVSLVIADLADKWALSRMPDLIPIPLAATVPGYLIRLPDGKILAAAMTNSFSIQGIQRGPLTANYKNFINRKIRSLIKPPVGKHSAVAAHNLGADTRPRPIVVAAASQSNNAQKHYNHREKASGLFSRGVLSQLGFSRSYHQRPNGTTNRDSSSKNRANRHKIVKLTSSPFSTPSFSDHELASLPIADVNEPIFSFADESQLIEPPPEYHIPMAGSTAHQSALFSNFGASQDLIQSATTAALRTKVNQLLSLRGVLGDGVPSDLFQIPSSKERRSPSSFSLLSKLEPPFAWLAKRARRLRSSRKTCRDQTKNRALP